MKYAVNVADLTKDPVLARFLFAPLLRTEEKVDAEPGLLDGKAVVIDCDSKKFEAILQIVRRKYNKNEFRLYERKKTKWVRR